MNVGQMYPTMNGNQQVSSLMDMNNMIRPGVHADVGHVKCVADRTVRMFFDEQPQNVRRPAALPREPRTDDTVEDLGALLRELGLEQ
jgi:hypothetical protein